MHDKLMIPTRLAAAPFYHQYTVEASFLQEKGAPFREEILWENGCMDEAPWDNPLTFVPTLFEEWEERLNVLDTCYAKRDTVSAEPVMIEQTAALLSVLSWMNRCRVPGADPDVFAAACADMRRMPSNVGGRLSFIVSRPSHHHSFMQLRSLFVESRKQFTLVKIEEKK
ncbi:YpoC family protein [Salibacterium lacus]|uniref:YpoC family protein n=1 Tax=Salibacterium lacus TaxID=1898109 RepID=A0ABW5SY64_9BACI